MPGAAGWLQSAPATDVHHVAVGVDQAGYHRGTIQPQHGGARFCRSAHGGGRANSGDPAIAHQHALGAAGVRHRNEVGILDDELHWLASSAVTKHRYSYSLTAAIVFA